MSHYAYDPDEWETVVHRRSCTACDGSTRKCNGMCNGSFGVGMKRRAPEDIARIKFERERDRENRILAEAEVIRARRNPQ